MATLYNPYIATNGLVLCLDVANNKSFFGEPTTNLVSDPLALSGFPSPFTWSGFEATSERVSSLPNADMYKISPYWIKLVKTSAVNGRAVVYGGGGLNTGVDYCRSFYVYTNDANLSVLRWQSDNGAVSTDQSWTTYTPSDRGTIKRVQTVFRSVSGNAVDVLRFGSTDPIGTTVWITGLQIEQKSYPTRLVTGTRGTTVASGGGWKNMASSTNDAEILNGVRESSVASGALSFDGSNDYVTIGQGVNSSFSEFTSEIVFRSPVAGNSGTAYLLYDNVSGNPFWLGKTQSNTWLWFWNFAAGRAKSASISSTSYVSNSWIHIAVRGHLSNTTRLTETNNYAELIINGESNSTSHSNTDDAGLGFPSGSAYIARRGASFGNGELGATVSEYATIDVALFRLYNKVLSRSEIAQNFSSIRGRFGI